VGMLMDLEYAERLAAQPGVAPEGQVWLTGDTPPEVVDRLRDQGLVIIDDQSVDSVQAASDNSGAALALRFYVLAAGMAVLVGLGALVLVTAVDRRTWRRSLRELHSQGLAERTTTAAALWSYGGMVVAGAVAGGLAAVAAWLATGQRLPFGVEESALVYWPQWTVAAGAWSVVVLVLLAAAVAAGARKVGD
jgi:putative ABC transport system permease protein